MAHNINHGNMAYVGEEPWHGLGKQVPANVSSEGMIKAAGLDWLVTKRPARGAAMVWARNADLMEPGAVVGPQDEVKYSRYELVRPPYRGQPQETVLGIVSDRYEPLQNKDGLLLVAQIKACVGTQANMYDHWRNRLIIEEGARQARTVVGELEKDRRLIASFSPIAAFRQARQLQPLVITTLDSFDGWKPDNVPVLGLQAFLHILRGANVVFRRQDGKVEASHAFSSGTNPTSEEFLRLLETPVNWHLANETPRQRHTWFDSEGILWGIPDLSDSPPAGDGQIASQPAVEATATR